MDANILVSKTCTDWLFQLRMENTGMFQVHVSEDVIAEVVRAMRRRSPTAPGHVTARRAEIIRSYVDEVVRDFPGNAPFSGRDPGDYHVHAAALASHADIVLTLNSQSDFSESPDDEPYEIHHPDEFFMLVTDSNPASLLTLTQRQIDYWISRGGSCQLDDRLRQAGCPDFADRVRVALQHLAARP